MSFFVVYYTFLLGPDVGVQRLCTRPPCSLKGRRPLEKNSDRKGTEKQKIDSSTDSRAILLSVDVGYYAPAARTTLNPRVFLCACFMGRSEVSLALPPSNHPQGLGGCSTPPDCGPPPKTTTYFFYSTSIWYYKSLTWNNLRWRDESVTFNI